GAAPTTAAPMMRARRDRPLPLSFVQQRLWFVEVLGTSGAEYAISASARLSGCLDTDALRLSLVEIVRRHEALRTSFESIGGTPVQRVAEPGPVELPVTELGSEASRRLHDEISADAESAFDLSRGPLIRFRLLRLAAEDHVLVVTMHHVISDGWSLGVFAQELSALYEAFSKGRPSPLPELAVQYPDFAAWQRGWLSGAELDRQLSFWRRHLHGAPEVIELPTDHQRPPVQVFRAGAEPVHIPREVALALREAGAGATPFMLLLSAFAAFLYRYTGQDDVVVGCPVAGRNRAEVEDLIGFFVNTLVVRSDVSGNPTFAELVERVRCVTLDTYEHQDLPFEKLVEELRPKRDLSHTPLIQVMFILHNTPPLTLDLPGLRPALLDAPTNAVSVDLTVELTEGPDGITGSFIYNATLFEADTIRRMVAHFLSLLSGAVADPSKRVSDLPLLSEQERRRAVVEWNMTKTPYPSEATIPELFGEIAARHADDVAVEAAGREMTYAELDARSSQLAHHLRDLGVGPDILVGLATERGVEMVVGMLAILKAGGAYMPLDLDYPPERLAFMLSDSEARVVLTQRDFEGRLPTDQLDAEATVIRLDEDWPEISRRPTHPPPRTAMAGNFAHAVYTSGSTGVPKGICVPHRGIVRLVRGTDYLQLSPFDVVAQVANASFDASTFEIWGPLLNGGRMAVVDKEVLLSPEALGPHLASRGVNVLLVTTALFNQIAAHAPESAGCLDHLMFGGEAVDPKWVRAMLSGRPPRRLIHVYGPSESTTFASWHLVESVEPDATTVPIGRPVANTTMYVLDPQLEPVPVGVAGEIHLGGDGLARGYLHRPQLTKERFVPDPFSDAPGARLYRTGDLARYRADGAVEFLGRLDGQVKLRGFRVELGEIEAVLSEHPDVAQAVVVVRQDRPDDKRLAAYLVPHPGSSPAPTDLRKFLSAKLPSYMVPAAFVVMDALPLSPNGKVDRRALPAPEHVPDSDSHVEPRNATERVLAGMWSEVLGVTQVGALADFFDLGGHSLLATQLVSRIRTVFKVELPLRRVFETPTLEAQAAQIDTLLESAPARKVPELKPLPRR
ncbi:MAG TPA: amino acid adenylation domain-containing protein, partial [Actinomycetota bacterium]|nr:amino acid adenylation domain-containing protein [Actinomycetota bacterium]